MSISHLNPLTAIFLSGVATQLIFILFINNVQKDHKKKDFLHISTYKRMQCWYQVFNEFCIDYYKKYSETYEKEEFESLRELNPFLTQTNLMIKYSTILLNYIKDKKIGNNAFKKVKEWFLLLSNLKESYLCQDTTFLANVNKIINLKDAFDCLEKKGHGCDRCNDFLTEFSPLALFIRSAFIVNIHQTKMTTNLFSLWEKSNVRFLSKYLCIDKYVQEFSREEKCNYFSIDFPIIHHLPCMDIYKMWDATAQKSSPIPIELIYTFILDLINGRMLTFHYHQRNQFSKQEINDMQIFSNFYSKAKLSITTEVVTVKKREKQALFQQRKKNRLLMKNEQFGENNIIDEKTNGESLTLSFIFPKNMLCGTYI